MSIEQCHLITFPKITDARGNLTFIENNRHIPFEIKRVFYLYDVPGGESRGGHAHRALQQIIIAVSGSFEMIVDDGFSRKVFSLNRAFQGLYLPKMHWGQLTNFASGSVCLVLTSELYDESDYFRDYDKFLAALHYEDKK
jgi:hypothetical protein